MRGSLKQRSKGSWTIWLELDRDASGKRRRRTLTIHGTKKEAEARLRELLHQQDTGSYISPSKLTFGDYLGRWLADYAAHNVRARTLDGYRDVIERHLIPALGQIPLTSLNAAHIQGYYAQALDPAGWTARVGCRPGLSTTITGCWWRP